jgi:hypothetical protein
MIRVTIFFVWTALGFVAVFKICVRSFWAFDREGESTREDMPEPPF